MQLQHTTHIHSTKTHPHPDKPQPTAYEDPHPLEMYPDLLDQAAEALHLAWIQKNPPTPHNLSRRIPYQYLPENHKQKNRDRILTASRVLENTPRSTHSKKNMEEIAQAVGWAQHEKWRMHFDPNQTGLKNIKFTPNGPKNTNVPWEHLDPTLKTELITMGKETLKALGKLNTAIGESIVQALGKRFLACN